MSGDKIWTGFFPDDDIPRILQIVQRCASSLRKRAPCESENSLSDLLYHRIQRDVEFRDMVPAQLYREISIYRDNAPVEEDSEPPRPGPIGRVDFVFINGTGLAKPYPEFVIEAKRLHVTFPRAGWRSLVNEYVSGDQGMMCFISGRYAPTQRAGAMLAYVFDGNVVAARAAIEASVATNSVKLRLKACTSLAPVTLPGIHADETWHVLDRGDFKIFHLLAKV